MTMVAKRVPRLIANVTEGERESRTIAVLRDAALPKFISDELRISRGKDLSVETKA